MTSPKLERAPGALHLTLLWVLRAAWLGLVITVFAMARPAEAAMVSYFLDESNEPALSDGTRHLRVDIEEVNRGGLDTDIRFTVTLLGSLTSSAGTNFGIQSFGFNVADGAPSVAPTQLELPSGWSVATGGGNNAGFGFFDFDLAGKGSSRQAPTLVFYITGVEGDEPGDYAAGSSNDYSFTAHVGDFDGPDAITSAHFGGSTLVPLPGSLLLLVSALGGLGFSRLSQLMRRFRGSAS